MIDAYPIELVALEELTPHPRNYVQHPADELEHIKASIQQHGFYKNIVISSDGYILAGHGAVEAARQLGMATLPARRLPILHDDPRALKVLTGDNEIMHLREIDDRALSELFKEIKESDAGLLGTGYDDRGLALLLLEMSATGNITIPDPPPQQEPQIGSECFVEMYCSQSDLSDFRATLQQWEGRKSVTINIS